MHIYRSNRIERLVDALAEQLKTRRATDSRPVLEPDRVVVQGRGMERWISVELARRLGVCANVAFPFPREFLESAIQEALGEPSPSVDVFQPETLTWAIAARLPTLLDDPGFDSLRDYLRDDKEGRRLVDLSRRIAETFDRYLVYRPDMISRWESETTSVDWQATLWRSLVGRYGRTHLVSGAAALGNRAPMDAATSTSRVFVFGVSFLPPLYAEIFSALSRRIETHVFVLSPCQEYWADLRADRTPGAAAAESEPFYLEGGHPLLGALGRLGGEFQCVLEETPLIESDHGLYEDPRGKTLAGTWLQQLQADMLYLREPTPSTGTVAETGEIAEGEVAEAAPLSIQVHNCHGPMREVEVVRDLVLGALEADPRLTPNDIVVMSPDIESYAPYVEAVFGSRLKQSDEVPIPFRVVDRKVRSRDPYLGAVLTLLNVVQGRLTSRDVLDLLSLEGVRARFSIMASEFEQVREWVAESGVRWGFDAAHRAEYGQPAEEDAYTWRYGTDRLVLGWVMPERVGKTFAGLVPCDRIGEDGAALAERMLSFVDAIGRFRAESSALRSVGQWETFLLQWSDAFVVDVADNGPMGRGGSGRARLCEALSKLSYTASAVQFDATIGLRAVVGALDSLLSQRTSSGDFLGLDGVTFCELVPMRSLPFHTVIVMGMSSEQFPRRERRASFDRTAERRRRGDRAGGDEDAYLFLEALLAARENFWVTYSGRSLYDHTEVAPSVPVEELLDVLTRMAMPGCAFQHALHPFDPTYFTGSESRLRSFSQSALRSARAVSAPKNSPAPFAPTPRVDGSAATRPGDGTRTFVSLEALFRFLRDPCAYFLRNTLGIQLLTTADLVEREPLEIAGLQAWTVMADALERRPSPPEWFAYLHGKAIAPIGRLGEVRVHQIARLSERMAALLETYRTDEPWSSCEVDMTGPNWALHGHIEHVRPGLHLTTSASKAGRGTSELGPWTRHVALNAAQQEPHRTVLILPDSGRMVATSVQFQPPSKPRAVLEALIKVFIQGQSEPLPLFADASRKYAACVIGNASHTTALAKAKEELLKNNTYKPHWAQTFRGRDLFTEGPDADLFGEVALAVFEPLLRARAQPAGLP